jgi:hypothetical protein
MCLCRHRDWVQIPTPISYAISLSLYFGNFPYEVVNIWLLFYIMRTPWNNKLTTFVFCFITLLRQIFWRRGYSSSCFSFAKHHDTSSFLLPYLSTKGSLFSGCLLMYLIHVRMSNVSHQVLLLLYQLASAIFWTKRLYYFSGCFLCNLSNLRHCLFTVSPPSTSPI